MRIKTIVPAIAIALAATIGSASAAEQFAALVGIPVVPMTRIELTRTTGGDWNILAPDGTVIRTIPIFNFKNLNILHGHLHTGNFAHSFHFNDHGGGG